MKINKRGGPNKVRRGGGKRSKLISGGGGGEGTFIWYPRVSVNRVFPGASSTTFQYEGFIIAFSMHMIQIGKCNFSRHQNTNTMPALNVKFQKSFKSTKEATL